MAGSQFCHIADTVHLPFRLFSKFKITSAEKSYNKALDHLIYKRQLINLSIIF